MSNHVLFYDQAGNAGQNELGLMPRLESTTGGMRSHGPAMTYYGLPPRYPSIDDMRLPRYSEMANTLSLDHIRQYLLLLASMNALRKSLSSLTGHENVIAEQLSADERWSLCVQIAVNRFGVWQKSVLSRHRAECISDPVSSGCPHRYLPPPDVIMVWAAYLQCPTRYGLYCCLPLNVLFSHCTQSHMGLP